MAVLCSAVVVLRAAPGFARKLLTFSRLNRLVSDQDFQSVFAQSKKTSHQFLLALYQSNQQVNARLGMVIGKRYLKKAVDRNQLKRAIRESFRHHQEALKGLDIIVLLRSECTPLGNRKALREVVDKLWQSIALPKSA